MHRKKKRTKQRRTSISMPGPKCFFHPFGYHVNTAEDKPLFSFTLVAREHRSFWKQRTIFRNKWCLKTEKSLKNWRNICSFWGRKINSGCFSLNVFSKSLKSLWDFVMALFTEGHEPSRVALFLEAALLKCPTGLNRRLVNFKIRGSWLLSFNNLSA